MAALCMKWMISTSVRLYVARAVKRMRDDGLICKMIGVYIQTSRFDKTERYSPYIVVQMHEHTDDLLLITKAAMKGIDQIFKKGLSIKRQELCCSKSQINPSLCPTYLPTIRISKSAKNYPMQLKPSVNGLERISSRLALLTIKKPHGT
ncbi:hypothetical protein I593_02808 [Acinetobacter tandoii DSM 14970 = CIP 107469]|uniref:DNA polymerase Y-family little finger domain-containing protein n=1 Tax=Acinetobacter tandoii DSM 14970 = CIP 107469 TaxID=1120927 RepID=R9AVC4_9GAMM|nr:hypothetical protein I593_02808 [Acinetobacter tandoii DSM 14970 = CIP 107469]